MAQFCLRVAPYNFKPFGGLHPVLLLPIGPQDLHALDEHGDMEGVGDLQPVPLAIGAHIFLVVVLALEGLVVLRGLIEGKLDLVHPALIEDVGVVLVPGQLAEPVDGGEGLWGVEKLGEGWNVDGGFLALLEEDFFDSTAAHDVK